MTGSAMTGSAMTAGAVTGKVLVAGIGNVFLGDDGFGVEVASRLAGADLPDGVKVVDYGFRGMHLAYDLANGFDAAILIDAVPRGEAPGTIYVIEPDLGPAAADAVPAASTGTTSADATSTGTTGGDAAGAEPTGAEPAGALAASPLFDAHGMQPDVVFGMLDMLDGGRPDRILVVGCEPASVDYGMELSEPVAASVDEAVRVVLELVTPAGGQREQDQGVTAAGAESAAGQDGLLAKGWTHVPRHTR
jgi:hydrogenase maturation protease